MAERDRFWFYVLGDVITGCLLWQGTTARGYGQFTPAKARRKVYAHRYAYASAVGPIPEGLDLDHLCANRACVRPSHLEPVTRHENLRRAWARQLGVAVAVVALSILAPFTAYAERVVTLTNGNDVYHANKEQRGAQTILALAGDDRVWGGVGADTQKGGPGNDRLHGIQPGADTLIGGPGWDVCVVSSIGNDTTRGCEVVKTR